jgi:lon-related putative ATP-dependent protease
MPSPAGNADTLRLSTEDLGRRCDPGTLGFATTEEVEPLDVAVGQPRALRAIEFGLGIDSRGYNVFAVGPSGTGKRTMLTTYLENEAAARPSPPDHVYFFNFDAPDRPLAVTLPAGRGAQLARDVADAMDEARREIRRVFESDQYRHSRKEITDALDARREERFAELDKIATELGFAVQIGPAGVVTAPLVKGQPATTEQFRKLPEAEQHRLREIGKRVEEHIGRFITDVRAMERDARERVQALDREIALFAIGHLMDDLKESYADVPAVGEWLDDAREDVIEHLEQFQQPDESDVEVAAPVALAMRHSREEFLARYAVNVLVSREANHGAPVVTETNPTYHKLFGRIDYRAAFGALETDHRQIKAGAMHRANGGYLLLQALDVLTRPFVWERLKDVLRTGRLAVENMGADSTMLPTATLTPGAIDLDVKVILVGPAQLYEMLFGLDEDFRKLFKVKADFDVEMPWADEPLAEYARFISRQVRADGLRHFDAAAVARAIEYGSRAAGDQHKLSTRFIQIADLVTEASHWAASEDSALVRAEHVDRAVEERLYRSNLIEEKVRELFAAGTIMVDFAGAKVGQVNGLEVLMTGDHAFGRPVRITAATSAGHGDVIDIDREIELSGPVHDKGFLTLSGFLRDRYARDKPLSLSASLNFEQSYDEVEGDSAASAELYALMSSLAETPVRQGIAVTGSVNQRGEVQPIGGVNHKIEGFFEVCKQAGLDGEQGVVIPRTNVRHLMLRREVREAVDEGRFHVWAVETIDEGIELLTGVPAGEPGPDGTYPSESIHGRIEARLTELAEVVREYGGQPDGADGKPAASRSH